MKNKKTSGAKNPGCLDEEVVRQVVNGNLAPQHKKQVFAHLAACEDCRQLVENFSLVKKGRRNSPSATADKNHLSEELLIAYFENTLSSRQRARVEKHLDHCDLCLSQLTFLQEAESESVEANLPPVESELLAKAKALVPPGRKGKIRWIDLFQIARSRIDFFFSYFPRLKVAGAVIVVIFLVGSLFSFYHYRQDPKAKNISITRNAVESQQRLLQGLRPLPEASVKNYPIVFSWNRPGNARFFKFLLYNDIGDVIFESTLTENSIEISSRISLEDDKKYFWKVEAFLGENDKLVSALNFFTFSRE